MSRTENATCFVAAVLLLVGFAFVAPPASAAQEDEPEPAEPPTVVTIPPCAATPEIQAGPASVGLNDFCGPWAEVGTDVVDCQVEEDRPDVHASCDVETSNPNNCPQVYWYVDLIVVTWEQRSTCDGDIEIRDDRLPS